MEQPQAARRAGAIHRIPPSGALRMEYSLHSANDVVNVTLFQLGRKGQTDGLPTDPHGLRVVLRSPAESLLIERVFGQAQIAVSYTHLTLPTIYSV